MINSGYRERLEPTFILLGQLAGKGISSPRHKPSLAVPVSVVAGSIRKLG